MLNKIIPAVVLFASLAAHAQTTLINASGTKVLDSYGNPLAAGKISFIPTNAAGTPVSYTPYGGVTEPAGTAFTATVTNGVFQFIGNGPFQILNTNVASPSGLVFDIKVTDPTGQTVYLDLPKTAINQPSYTFDSYFVAGGVTVSGMGQPRLNCVPGSLFNQTDAVSGAPEWVCSQLTLTDKSIVWTQNPSSSESCQGGLAIAQPKYGAAYCLPPYYAWGLPGQGLITDPNSPSPFRAGQLSGTGSGGISALTGDVIGSGVGSVSTTLATVNSNVGPCGDATHVSQITLDAKGRATGCVPVAITGGGGGTPGGSSSQVQTNQGGAFSGDPSFTFNATSKTLTTAVQRNTAGITLLGYSENASYLVYDLLNPAYSGGIAAAVAGTSGSTPTQVITAALNYGECQYLMGQADGPGTFLLPSNIGTIPITLIQPWSGQTIEGGSLYNHAGLQHATAATPMITGHGVSDPLTCSNGTTYTPGTTFYAKIHGIGIAGTGSGINDIGINTTSGNWTVSDISGFGNGFGGQAILIQGLQNYVDHVGQPGSQLKGCLTYVGGTNPVSSSVAGVCGAIQDSGVDDEITNSYATDGQRFAGVIGSCYPNCGAFAFTGANAITFNLFGQVSDVDFVVANSYSRNTSWRADDSLREGIYFAGGTFGTGTFSDLQVTGACTDPSLAANFNANVPTGCGALNVSSNANQITNVAVNTAAPFGQSYMECYVRDNGDGGSAIPNSYAQINYNPVLSNTTNNNNKFCGTFNTSEASGKVTWETGQILYSNGMTTIDASGVTSLDANGAAIKTAVQGVPGQRLNIYGLGVTVTGNFSTCSGTASAPTGLTSLEFIETGPYNSNTWAEVCH